MTTIDPDAGLKAMAGKAQADIDKAIEHRLMPPPSKPMEVARKLIDKGRYDGHRVISYWRGGWYFWKGSHWSEVDEVDVTALIYKRLEKALYKHSATANGVTTVTNKDWDPNKGKVTQVREALQACVIIDPSVDSPSWFPPLEDGVYTPAGQIVAFQNGHLDISSHVDEDGLLVSSRTFHKGITPSLFNEVGLPFNYDPNATEPDLWLTFLDQVFMSDKEAIAELQMMFGYMISGRTDQQKILLMTGQKRSGKGTIARTLQALVGKGNCAASTLASLGTNFGLQPLIGKSLCVIADARIEGRSADVATVVERLLTLSGGDPFTIDRKFRTSWYGTLPTRIVILSNELPRLNDASGAVADRFITINTATTFFNKEDTGLGARLLTQLPGILNWALDGLDALNKRGYLKTPESSRAATEELADLTSPVSAFVRDCCADTGEVDTQDLFKEWCTWADARRMPSGSQMTFGRNLRAAKPGLRDSVQYRSVGGKRGRKYVGISLDLPVTKAHLPVTPSGLPVTPSGWPGTPQSGSQN